MSTTLSRRRLAAAALGLAAPAIVRPNARTVARQATPVVSGAAPATAPGALVVADNGAAALHVFALPSLDLLATLPGVTVNDHAGFLPLPGDRLLYIDSGAGELVALELASDREPAVTGRLAVPETVSHIAVDATADHAVVGSSDEARPITLVDLSSFTSRSFDVEAGEVGIGLGGDPLMLFHRNDVASEVEGYLVSAIARGESDPVGTVPTGAFGHGEVVSHELSLFCTATDDGLDVVSFAGGELTYEATLPWDAGGRTGGRGYFARLSADGRRVYSYMADRPEDRPWGEWRNDLWVADLTTMAVTRTPLAPGYVFRFGLGDRNAVFHHLHPEGDHALVVDTDPASASHGEVTATIPLAPLTDAPGAEGMPWDAEGRVSTVTPDGALGLVTHGGDGLISLVDTATGEISGQLTTPTPLSGGGYLAVIQDGMPFSDTIGR